MADDDEITPFSLADLGLTDEELAQLGLETGEQAAPPPSTESNAALDDEVTPFSLADLGLTDEELELIGTGADENVPAQADAPSDIADGMRFEWEEPEAAPGRAEETAGGAELPELPFSPGAPAVMSEGLAGFESVDTVEVEDRAAHALTPAEPSINDADTMPFAVLDPPMGDRRGDSSAAPREQAGEAVTPPASIQASRQGETAGGADLARFYEQLEAQPENHAMRLALARMAEQQGDIERSMEQYRQLIRRNALLEPVTEDLQEMSSGQYDRAMLRRLHRLLGDAYMKQERLQEAMEEYSWT